MVILKWGVYQAMLLVSGGIAGAIPKDSVLDIAMRRELYREPAERLAYGSCGCEPAERLAYGGCGCELAEQLAYGSCWARRRTIASATSCSGPR